MKPLQDLRASWAERRRQRAEVAQERLAERRRVLDEKVAARQRAADFESLHRLRLEKAISVSSMELACHEDTWQEIEKSVFPSAGYVIGYHRHMVDRQQFPQSRIGRPNAAGICRVKLSGPHLVRTLTVFRAVLSVGSNHATVSPEEYALARRMYDLLAARVDAVDMNSSEGALPVLIVDASLEEAPES